MNVDELAQKIWDYQVLKQPLEKADAILVFGSHDNYPALYAIELFKQAWAPYIIFSGGALQTQAQLGTKGEKTEAEVYQELALKAGIPEDKIFIENESTNTGANLELSLKLVEEKGFKFTQFILLNKPYNERRLRALVEKQAPDKTFFITSEPVTFKEYCRRDIPKERIINSIVGDLQRLKVYGEKGFQMPVEMPKEVWDAYLVLVEMGYTG